MLEICPKCKSKSVYFDDEAGYERNACISCGWSHTPNSYKQSFDRQVHGDNTKSGLGLYGADYEESLKGKDSDYDKYTKDPLYHYKKDLAQRQDPDYEKKVSMGRKLLVAIQKKA